METRKPIQYLKLEQKGGISLARKKRLKTQELPQDEWATGSVQLLCPSI